MDYAEKLKDPRWQKKRLEIFERDGWGCKSCGNKNIPLHIHHLFYLKDTEPWEIPNGFLITFCENCHSLENIKRATFMIIGKLLDSIWKSGIDFPTLSSLQKQCQNPKILWPKILWQE